MKEYVRSMSKLMMVMAIVLPLSLGLVFCGGGGGGDTQDIPEQVDHIYYREIDSGNNMGYNNDIIYKNEKIFIGYLGGDTYDTKIAISEDEGVTWNYKTVDSVGNSGCGVAIATDGTNIYMGYYETGSYKIKCAKSENDGKDWTVYDVVTSYSNPVYIKMGAQNGNVFICYDYLDSVKLSKSINGGINWSTQTVVTADRYSEPICFMVDGNNVNIVFHETMKIDSTYYGVLNLARSTDGATTWDTTTTYIKSGPDSSYGWYPAIYSNGNTIQLSYIDSKSNLMYIKSVDSGSSWSDPVRVLDGFTSDKICLHDTGKEILIMTARYLYTSKDGGVTWQKGQMVIGSSYGGSRASIAVNGDNIYVSEFNLQTDPDCLLFFKSEDLGNSWVEW